MKHTNALAMVLAWVLVMPAQAQIAAPFHLPQAWLGSVMGHQRQQALHMIDEAQALQRLLKAECRPLRDGPIVGEAVMAYEAVEKARRSLARVQESWWALQSVMLGPLIDRRTARRIDFQPIRPATLQTVLSSLSRPGVPLDEQVPLDEVGAASKGLGTLTWMWWERPKPQQGQHCEAAQVLTADVLHELSGLVADQTVLLTAQGETDVVSEAADQGAESLVNQWLGGIEALRWREVGKPLASGKPGLPPAFLHRSSGLTLTSWHAHWQGLRQITVGPSAPSDGQVISVEAYLRGRGLNPLADRLLAHVRVVDGALPPLRAGQPSVSQARRLVVALTRLKALAEEEIAGALQVNIGFSDADGD